MIDTKTLMALRSDPAAFRENLLIETDDGPRPLGTVLDPWQQADFAALDNGWHLACGHRLPEGAKVRSRGYLERPRGHSKTNDLAVMAVWALFASGRRLRGIAASGDKDQAKLLRDAIEQLVRHNPWLSKVLDVQTYKVRNTKTGAELDIISSDAPSSYGATPDFIIVDELTHWVGGDDENATTRSGGRKLWHSLISSAAKRRHCIVVVIANAGLGKGSSWQWHVRETCRTDPAWHFSHLNGPVASWIDPSRLAEQRRLLSAKAYLRLWENVWTLGEGDALDPEDIDAAVVLPRPLAGAGPERSYGYVAGLDLGVRNDHAALVVVGCHGATQRLKLASCESWAPVAGQVDLIAVKEAVVAAQRRFGLQSVYYDPHQAELMAQQLRREGVSMIDWPFVGKNLDLIPLAAAHAGLLATTLTLGDQVRGNVGVSADRQCHQSHPLLQVARQVRPHLALALADFFSSQAGYRTASTADGWPLTAFCDDHNRG